MPQSTAYLSRVVKRFTYRQPTLGELKKTIDTILIPTELQRKLRHREVMKPAQVTPPISESQDSSLDCLALRLQMSNCPTLPGWEVVLILRQKSMGGTEIASWLCFLAREASARQHPCYHLK